MLLNMETADKNLLYRHVEFLTTLKPARNSRNLNSLHISARYIESEFRKAGAVTSVQTWKASGREYENIITAYNASASKRLIVGAHYDVAGDQPGADDNASAVAGLIELVRLINYHKPIT